MCDLPPHPTRRPTARFARRYGPTFNAFDHLANVSLCSQKLGQVEIDCRFRHSKTQWGVLGPAENQAGILYMDLSFAQSKNCRLSSATVWVSLEDPDRVKKSTKSHAAPTRSASREDTLPLKSGMAPNSYQTEDSKSVQKPFVEYDIVRFLQFTHDFGPRQLAGEPTKATTKKTLHLTPQINVLGNGGGGLGLDHEQSIEQTSRWTFTGNLLRGSKLGNNASDIVYRTLKWELSEDDFQPQTTHSNTIQTAFTLEHDDNQFILRIEIQGKLERKHERMKNHVKQLLKFPKDPSKSQGISLTMVNPRTEKATRRLDNIARGLPFDMERLNLEAVRPQLPTTLPISFWESTQLSRDESTTTATAVEENNTGLPTTDHTAEARLPDFRVPGKISSFPKEEEIIIRRAPTNEIPVKIRNRIAESPTRDRSTTSRSQAAQSTSPLASERRNPGFEKTPFKQQGERRKNIPRDFPAEEVLAPKPGAKPVRISSSLEPFEEKHSSDDLNELALQLVQFPFLLRIMLWFISIMSSTSNKVPRKSAMSE